MIATGDIAILDLIPDDAKEFVVACEVEVMRGYWEPRTYRVERHTQHTPWGMTTYYRIGLGNDWHGSFTRPNIEQVIEWCRYMQPRNVEVMIP